MKPNCLTALLGILPLLAACEDAEITKVKKSSLPYCESHTVSEVMDSLLQKAYWGIDSDVSGKRTVVVEGMLLDDEKQLPVEFKFDTAVKDGHSELMAFAVEQRPKSNVLAHQYFSRVCAEDYLSHIKSGIKSSFETAVEKGKSAVGAIQEVYKDNEEEIGEVSGKVRDLSGKLFHETVRKVGDALNDEKDSVPSSGSETPEP